MTQKDNQLMGIMGVMASQGLDIILDSATGIVYRRNVEDEYGCESKYKEEGKLTKESINVAVQTIKKIDHPDLNARPNFWRTEDAGCWRWN